MVSAIELLGRIRTVTTIAIAAIFLCYVIYPAVRRLNAHLPLWASLLIVYVVLIAIVAGVLSYVVPAVSGNVRQFVHDAPGLVRSAQAELANPNNPILSRLPPEIKVYIERLPMEIVALANRYGGEAAGRFISVAASVVGFLAIFVVVPIVAIYMMIDKDSIFAYLVSTIPPAKKPRVLKILNEINGVVGGFVRGQLLVALIVGTLITILLLLLHVRYAFLIGSVAGLFEIIPYLGAFAGAIPAVLVSLVTNGPANAAFVVMGFIAINQLEGHVISPIVVGQSVGLSALVIVLSLLAGGELFGLGGLILAVPIAGVIKVLLVNLVPRYASAA